MVSASNAALSIRTISRGMFDTSTRRSPSWFASAKLCSEMQFVFISYSFVSNSCVECVCLRPFDRKGKTVQWSVHVCPGAPWRPQTAQAAESSGDEGCIAFVREVEMKRQSAEL
jgi:hypothetical protein